MCTSTVLFTTKSWAENWIQGADLKISGLKGYNGLTGVLGLIPDTSDGVLMGSKGVLLEWVMTDSNGVL